MWLYSVRITHGYWNVTDELPDGPTESTVTGGALGSASTVLVVAVVVLPLVLIPLAFIMFKRAKKRGED